MGSRSLWQASEGHCLEPPGQHQQHSTELVSGRVPKNPHCPACQVRSGLYPTTFVQDHCSFCCASAGVLYLVLLETLPSSRLDSSKTSTLIFSAGRHFSNQVCFLPLSDASRVWGASSASV